MKTIDFSKPGGFPFTQDILSYLQTGYSEAFAAVMGTISVPVIMNGMVLSGASTSRNVSAGWFFFNGQFIRFVSSNYNSLILGIEPYVVIGQTSTPLTYNDTTTHNVVNETIGSIVGLHSTVAEDATHIKLSSFVSAGVALGLTYREQGWQHIVVATGAGSGSIGGDIYYKKDTIANTLQIRGALGAATPTDFAAWPAVSSLLMGTVASGYKPANNVYFTVQVGVGVNMLKDSNGTYFNRLNAVLQTDGKVIIDWLTPDVSIGVYFMQWNLVVPLD